MNWTRVGIFPEETRLHGMAAYAPLVLRLFIGTFLVYVSQDNVFNSERMTEFETFLGGFGFPAPHLMAPLSAYAQFVAGLCLLVGFATRLSALVMIANFLVALLTVHVGLPFREALDPFAMLAAATALVLLGPGRLSVDQALATRHPQRHGLARA